MTDDVTRRLSRDEKKQLGKREAKTAEALTRDLLAAKPEVLARVEMDREIMDAVVELRGLFAKKQRPRQLRHVQSLLRDADCAAISASLAASIAEGGYDPDARRAEQWRDRLVAEGDHALEGFIDDHPDVDRHALRGAILRARKATSENDVSRAKRELYELVKEALSSADQPSA